MCGWIQHCVSFTYSPSKRHVHRGYLGSEQCFSLQHSEQGLHWAHQWTRLECVVQEMSVTLRGAGGNPYLYHEPQWGSCLASWGLGSEAL